MPVRKVSSHGRNVIGRFPSLKMGRMIAFESLLERDFIYLLDYDQQVERFEEQPLTIEYGFDDQQRHYTPDFYVMLAGHSVLVECKPEHFVNTDENQRKFVVAHDWCIQRGWEFRVVTDQQVRGGFRLQNIKQLTQYARLTLAAEARSRIDAFLRQAPATLNLQQIVQALEPDDPQHVLTSLLHLAFHHEIELLLDTAPLSALTPVSWHRWVCPEVTA